MVCWAQGCWHSWPCTEPNIWEMVYVHWIERSYWLVQLGSKYVKFRKNLGDHPVDDFYIKKYTSLAPAWRTLHVLFSLPGMLFLQLCYSSSSSLTCYVSIFKCRLSEASTGHPICGGQLLRWPPVRLIPWSSCSCIIPCPWVWAWPSDSLLRNRIQDG